MLITIAMMYPIYRTFTERLAAETRAQTAEIIATPG